LNHSLKCSRDTPPLGGADSRRLDILDASELPVTERDRHDIRAEDLAWLDLGVPVLDLGVFVPLPPAGVKPVRPPNAILLTESLARDILLSVLPSEATAESRDDDPLGSVCDMCGCEAAVDRGVLIGEANAAAGASGPLVVDLGVKSDEDAEMVPPPLARFRVRSRGLPSWISVIPMFLAAPSVSGALSAAGPPLGGV